MVLLCCGMAAQHKIACAATEAWPQQLESEALRGAPVRHAAESRGAAAGRGAWCCTLRLWCCRRRRCRLWRGRCLRGRRLRRLLRGRRLLRCWLWLCTVHIGNG